MHQREASLPVAVSVVAISVYWRRHVHVHALTLSRSYNEAVVTPCYSFIPSFLPSFPSALTAAAAAAAGPIAAP
jgi:hypothetical protein